jgi:hypothetical protein
VADGPPHVLGPGLGGGQDHAALAGAEVLELHHIKLVLLEDVLPDDADVGGPVLDEDGHVGGPADDEFGIPGPVDEPPPILANNVRGKTSPFERRQSILEDGTLRHRDAQPAQDNTASATDG